MITNVGGSAVELDMVSNFGVYGAFPPGILITAAAIAAGARTEYYALNLPTTHVVRRFWWVNGGTGTLRNVTMALYGDAGYKPGSKVGTATASTTQSAINVVQFAAPTGGDFSISPGLYWLALAVDTVTGAPTLFGNALAQQVNTAIGFQEATVTPPATATPAEKTSASYFLCGFSTTTLT